MKIMQFFSTLRGCGSASALTLMVAGGFAPSSGAQAQGVSVSDSTVVYPSAYFQEWSPVTVQDMLDRVPGLSNVNFGGGGGRGLGGGGGNQILIDGKRMPGKENQSSDQLSRIQAEQVDYIEIIRGSSGSLDVRADQIVNVVLLDASSSNSISYELNADRYLDHHVQPGGSVAYRGQAGDLTFVLSAEAEPRYDHYVVTENSRLGDYSPNDLIREDRVREQTSYTYTSNLGYTLNANSSVRLNALYSRHDNETGVERRTTDLRVTPNAVTLEREDIPADIDSWEVGGDYEYLFGNGSRFKFLFISNEDNWHSVRERYEVSADGEEIKDLFLASGSTTRERIARSSYTMTLADTQDIEMGVERAQTILDSGLRLGSATPGTPSPEYGGLVPVQVNNANSTVEEIRYEPFVVHNWQLSPRMSLESSLVYEMSEITQTGDIYNKRDFAFVKPKLDWRFNLTSSFQLRAVAEKSVRQLSFGDFISSSNDRDIDSETEAGNANLKQEQVLKLDLSAEYRLPNDEGVLDASVFYMKHLDVIERVDVSPSPLDIQSANGNIGDGIMYGLNLNANVRMTRFEMPNLVLTSQFNVQDSEITDPFLGIERRFMHFNRGRLQLGFRHDIPALGMNYGLNWNNRFDSNMKRYDIDNIEMQAGDPNVSAFVEFVAFGGTTFRFDARNATNNLSCRERQRFQGHISTGIITEIEDQCGTSGRVLSLKINGTF